jgi:hypothetical protein
MGSFVGKDQPGAINILLPFGFELLLLSWLSYRLKRNGFDEDITLRQMALF